MTGQQHRAAIDYHRAQIAYANEQSRTGRWTPSEAANHREAHSRLLRELEDEG
tara:strand:- start:544 stop:702 length:159 start_codon:yes stop_codon:yes gene_type:complete